jgi:hypothetical protein
MKTFLLVASGFLAYGVLRDAVPRMFIARVRYITAVESAATKKAPIL